MDAIFCIDDQEEFQKVNTVGTYSVKNSLHLLLLKTFQFVVVLGYRRFCKQLF